MQVIRTLPVPSQVVSATLAGQNCRIALYQRSTGMYCNIFVNDALLIGGVACRNCTVLVRSNYFGFVGDLFLKDLRGNSDPDYAGLGSRFILCYLEGPL